MTPELRKLLDNVTNLPSPPAVAARVIELAQEPEVQLAQVAEAIQCDASLAAKIMRVANSAMYARRRESTNLRQALVVLGLHATVTLALGFSLMPLLQRDKSQTEIFAHTWRRTLMSGLCARALADVTGKANAEEAFLSALLQDVGIMGIDRVMPGFYDSTTEFFGDHGKLIEFEHAALDADHAEVSAHLQHVWKLPEYLQDAVAVSHAVETGKAQDVTQHLSLVVALSGPLADAWLAGEEQPERMRAIAQVAERELKLTSDEISATLAKIAELLPDMAQLFDTNLIDDNKAQMIVEHAQEILTARTLQSQQAAEDAVEQVGMLRNYAENLEQESRHDALTQVASRRYLETLLEQGFRDSARFGWPLALMFVDLDHFKSVNDTFGHSAGEEVLRNVGRILNDALRDSDSVGRYGGEEFLVLLPGADEVGVNVVAERVLNTLRKATHSVGDARIVRVTASIGCAILGARDDYPTLEALVARADEALYMAKSGGRDRFILLPPPTDTLSAAKTSGTARA